VSCQETPDLIHGFIDCRDKNQLRWLKQAFHTTSEQHRVTAIFCLPAGGFIRPTMGRHTTGRTFPLPEAELTTTAQGPFASKAYAG
jgi:hypothetical protein